MTSYLGNSPGLAKRQLFRYISTTGQTIFTGIDANGLTLNYTPGSEDVYINGFYIPPANYNRISASSLSFIEGLGAGDEVSISAAGAYNPADSMAISQNGNDIANRDLFKKALQVSSPSSSGLAGYLTNPAFEFSQQNGTNAVSVSTNSVTVYGPDQWMSSKNGTVVLSMQQVSGNLSSVSSMRAFRNGMTTTATTAQASYTAGQFATANMQPIEDIFLRDLAWGTADAKSVDVAFIITASVMGTYALSIRDATSGNSYVTNFTLSTTSPTLIFKTIPGPTSGTWGNAYLSIGSVTGSTNQAPSLNTWASGNYFSSSACVNWTATTNATVTLNFCNMYAGGILPFTESNQIGLLNYLNTMKRSYDEELRRCQRYFQWAPVNIQFYSPNFGAENSNMIMLPVAMRIAPTIGVLTTDADIAGGGPESVNVDSYTITNRSVRHITLAVTSSATGSVTKMLGSRWPLIARL